MAATISCDEPMPETRCEEPAPQSRQFYDIQIAYAQNGYVCVVGCMTAVFETKKKMLDEISRYLDNPDDVEKEYQSMKRR